MKQLLLTLVSIFGIYTAFGQMSWTELEPHNREALQLHYVADNGDLIATLKYPEQILISKDKAQTWQVLFEGPLTNNTLKFGENPDGQLFVAIKKVLYSINKNQNLLDTVLIYDEFIDDFDFLPDGNMVVASRKYLRLYDKNYNLLKEHSWDTKDMELLLGANNRHYAKHGQGAEYIIVFNSDLSWISDDEILAAPNSFKFCIQENRLFSEDAYSDDGFSWISYEDGVNGLITPLGNGRVHIMSTFSQYISLDNGETFDWVGTNDNRYSSTWHDGSIGLYALEIRSDNKTLFHFSEGSSIFEEIDLQIGKPFAETVESGSDNNLMVKSKLEYDHYLNSTSSGWQFFDIDDIDFPCSSFGFLTSTPNGGYINNVCCNSYDAGLNWNNNLSSNVVSGWGKPYLKNNITYVRGYQSMYKTPDYGESWMTIAFNSGNGTNLSHVADVSANDELYMIDPLLDNIYKTTLSGELLLTIPPQSTAVSNVQIATSYVGEDLYVLYSQPDGTSLFMRSVDSGESFEFIDIAINGATRVQTDHLGNLYILTDHKVWMSIDKGSSWDDITPYHLHLYKITSLNLGWDSHIYISTHGTPIFKSETSLTNPSTLQTVVYEDENSNCKYDIGEDKVHGIPVAIEGWNKRITDSNGVIVNYLPEGEYTLSAEVRTDLFYKCDDNFKVNFTDDGTDIIVYMPIEILVDQCADLSVTSTTTLLRRCFSNKSFIEVYNDGNFEARNTELIITLDEFFEYEFSDMDLKSQQGQILTFSLPNIGPRESYRGQVAFNLSCDAELGQAHYTTSYATYDNPCSGGSTRQQDAFECLENIGSYDPNDKAIYASGFKNKEIIAEADEIEYLIRFQNTGTDTAFTVRIEDRLSSHFDWTSLYPVAASHDYEWSLERNKLNIQFNDILLVDSFANEEASHGFIKFNVKLWDQRPEPGTIIENTAEIFFDFNDPIVTNTVQSYYLCKAVEATRADTICGNDEYLWNGQVLDAAGRYESILMSKLGCDSLDIIQLTIIEVDDELCKSVSTEETSVPNINIFPIPANNHINIASEININSYELIDVKGNTVAQGELRNNKIELDAIKNGVYILKMYSSDHSPVQKKVMVLR